MHYFRLSERRVRQSESVFVLSARSSETKKRPKESESDWSEFDSARYSAIRRTPRSQPRRYGVVWLCVVWSSIYFVFDFIVINMIFLIYTSSFSPLSRLPSSLVTARMRSFDRAPRWLAQHPLRATRTVMRRTTTKSTHQTAALMSTASHLEGVCCLRGWFEPYFIAYCCMCIRRGLSSINMSVCFVKYNWRMLWIKIFFK